MALATVDSTSLPVLAFAEGGNLRECCMEVRRWLITVGLQNVQFVMDVSGDRDENPPIEFFGYPDDLDSLEKTLSEISPE